MRTEGLERLADAIKELPVTHTPTPWTAVSIGGRIWISSKDQAANIARIHTNGNPAGNTEFILKAVNAYDENQQEIVRCHAEIKRLMLPHSEQIEAAQQTIRNLLWTLAEITHEVIEMGEYPITAELSTAREFASRLLTRLGTCKS